jgi:hypothetical protein
MTGCPEESASVCDHRVTHLVGDDGAQLMGHRMRDTPTGASPILRSALRVLVASADPMLGSRGSL